MSGTEPEFVTRLRTMQSITGDSDAEFARRLGIDREHWRRVKGGEAQPGVKLLRGILRAYPGLREAVLDFLLPEDETIIADVEIIGAPAPSRTRKRAG